jgi:acyl-coenzyme A thioesterase PaaI-like protein
MPSIQLPHTAGCLVCGRDNPRGYRLNLFVDPESSAVTCDYTPVKTDIGFEGIVHGGVIATILDEAMVWAATWSSKRFCVCGELTTRFKKPVRVGEPITIRACISSSRSRLIETEATVRNAAGDLLASGGAKYTPLSAERNREFVATLVVDAATAESAEILTHASRGGY